MIFCKFLNSIRAHIINLSVDVTLENTEQEPYRVYVKMLNCVELITASDKDCSYMTLMGGDMGILNSKCPRNITLLYPNMVNLNRIYAYPPIPHKTNDNFAVLT